MIFKCDRVVRKTSCIGTMYYLQGRHQILFYLVRIIAKALATISCPGSLLVMTLNFCLRDPSSNHTRFVVVIILQ